MSKMIIMQGLPASGKSTKAEEILRTNGRCVRINKDLLRTMLHFGKFTGKNESMTRHASRQIAEFFLTSDTNVIIDDTNLNPGTVQGWVELAKKVGAKIEYCVMDTSVQECLDRDAQREGRVGDHVIFKMALEHKGFGKGEPAIICDLDGTIADIRHRLHFVKDKDPKDWDGFFKAISGDSPREDIIQQVMADAEGSMLIFVSGRPERCRKDTERWLNDHIFLHRIRTPMLIMRENHDKRPDTETKAEIYDRYLKDLAIIRVYDDRPSVIRMWREKGLNVVDVGQGVEF